MSDGINERATHALDSFRVIRRFLVAHHMDQTLALTLPMPEWAFLHDLADQWAAEQDNLEQEAESARLAEPPEMAEARRKAEAERKAKDAEDLLFHSSGGGD